ncbi:unnamed protein product [Rotaria sp. Silwood1]|nr:unnamed protein product [Rotaria sp. Silwood1]CAF4857870.1 unnamed protein product [Rotaria sp. Silwood1]
MQQNYDDAELDFLKHKAVVSMPLSDNRQGMTVAELERSNRKSSSAEDEPSNNRNKFFMDKIKDTFTRIYQKEKKQTKLSILRQVVGLIVVLAVAVLRACVPTIYRKYRRDYTFPNTTKPFQLAMAAMGGGVIFAAILGIVAIIQLIYYQAGGLVTLTTLLGIIDIGIIIILVLIFLYNIVIINTALDNVEGLLLRTKKEVFVQSTKRKFQDNDWNIDYLSAMAEQFSVDKDTYYVNIFGFIVNKALVIKAASAMIVSFTAQVMLFLKKKTNVE